MSFFGFEQNDLENDKQQFLDGGLQESEDVAVYEGYDGLADELQEGGDELNDETFGGIAKVGKDFDFSNPALPIPDDELRQRHHKSTELQREDPLQHERVHTPTRHDPLSRPPVNSLEALWDEKSSFSVLSRSNGVARSTERIPSANLAQYPAHKSPTLTQQPMAHGINHLGARTLQEIEAEMRAAALQSRGTALRQQQLLMQQQEHELQLRQRDLQYRHEQEIQQQRFLQQQALLQQQQQQQQQQRTPPPRMLPVSQSPRFHDRQHQILLLQQQQEQQQQQKLQELQDQLRLEEIERQLRAQQISQLNQGPTHYNHQRQISGPTELPAAQMQMLRHGRRQSPAFDPQAAVPLQHAMPYMPQNVQMQQRLLSELAQVEFLRDLQEASQVEQEALRMEAMRKIMEAERMEEKRRRKAAKIAHMARYNDLMTQSDKDFITRIQVSQLVTQDPYAEDFYAQVFVAIMRSRQGLQSQDERVLKFGASGGIGLGLAQKGGHRRPSAMQRMEAQVERIVSNARLREKEKGLHSIHSLQGALGKTSGRSYKAAPRQLLQVGTDHGVPNGGEGAAKEAAKLGREALGNAADTDGLVRKEPLTRRQVLASVEALYDLVLRMEQLRRDRPPQEEEEAFVEWEQAYGALVEELWDGLQVMVPLETSDPHPFISLLFPTKGKKILPRVSRHLSSQQMLTMLTLLVACFHQLDVVIQAPMLDSSEENLERSEVERQTQAFLGSVLQSILPVVASATLRLVSGLLGLLLDRSNVVTITHSRPGLALLTLLLSRVEVIKQNIAAATEVDDLPSPEEAQQWQLMFDHLFQLLTPHLLRLFPSIRLAQQVSLESGRVDHIEQPVWQFLAAMALHASPEQQQTLVASLREKVLENVMIAKKGWVADEDERQTKLANVNLFLHALGLDSSQIAM